MPFFAIVAIVALICINWMVANKMQSIAEEKGSTDRYWAWCFWLGIIGCAMVIALPDLNQRAIQKETKELLTKILSTKEEQKIEENKKQTQEQTKQIVAQTNSEDKVINKSNWKCPKCGKENMHYSVMCSCGFEHYNK